MEKQGCYKSRVMVALYLCLSGFAMQRLAGATAEVHDGWQYEEVEEKEHTQHYLPIGRLLVSEITLIE